MNYQRMRLMALRLIQSSGQLVTWNRTVAVENYEQPWNPTANQIVSHQVYVTYAPIEKDLKRYAQYKDSEVPEGFFAAYMGYNGFKPSLKDKMIRDNIEIRISHIDEINPSGYPIAYILYVKD